MVAEYLTTESVEPVCLLKLSFIAGDMHMVINRAC